MAILPSRQSQLEILIKEFQHIADTESESYGVKLDVHGLVLRKGFHVMTLDATENDFARWLHRLIGEEIEQLIIMKYCRLWC